MILHHVNVKFYIEGELTVDLSRVVELFHRWISEQAMGELLIDVADYTHLKTGPGIVLVGLGADYSLDNTGNRYGLRFNRKSRVDGSNEDRLGEALGAAAKACLKLEAEFVAAPPLRFSRQEFEIFFNDRALVPNTDESRSELGPILGPALERSLGHRAYNMRFETDPRKLLRAFVHCVQPFELETIAGDINR